MISSPTDLNDATFSRNQFCKKKFNENLGIFEKTKNFKDLDRFLGLRLQPWNGYLIAFKSDQFFFNKPIILSSVWATLKRKRVILKSIKIILKL